MYLRPILLSNYESSLYCFRLIVLSDLVALSQPRLVAERIVAALPQPNPVILSAVAAPNGFINVTLQPSLFTQVTL